MQTPEFLTPVRSGVLAACLMVLAGCSTLGNVTGQMASLGGLITPYKIDIVQGNVITREQVEALKPGMTRLQVRDELGTPLLQSVFHAQRWDYVFTYKRQGQPEQKRRLAVFFKGDELERFEADEMPSEAEFVASLDVKRKSGKPPVLEATPEQLQSFHERNKAPASAAPAGAEAAPAAAAPAASYPPLEAAR